MSILNLNSKLEFQSASCSVHVQFILSKTRINKLTLPNIKLTLMGAKLTKVQKEHTQLFWKFHVAFHEPPSKN